MVNLMLAWFGASFVFGLGWALSAAMQPAGHALLITVEEGRSKRIGKPLGVDVVGLSERF